MSLELVKQYLESYGLSDRILVYDASSATVALAAKAIGTAPEHIAKSLTFGVGGGCVMIVMAGDARVDNAKLKHCFTQNVPCSLHNRHWSSPDMPWAVFARLRYRKRYVCFSMFRCADLIRFIRRRGVPTAVFD